MSIPASGITAYDSVVIPAEGIRQSAVGVASVTQAAARTADIVFYRAALANAAANKVDPGPFIRALMDLRTGGV